MEFYETYFNNKISKTFFPKNDSSERLKEIKHKAKQSKTDGTSTVQAKTWAQQLQINDGERYQEKANEFIGDFSKINSEIDVDFLLAELVDTHGLLREKYKTASDAIQSGKQIPAQRIRCGTRTLSASDFLTNHMGMRWTAAREYLRNTFIRQKNYVPNLDARKGRPDSNLWSDFVAIRTKLRREARNIVKQNIRELWDTLSTEIGQLRMDRVIQVEMLTKNPYLTFAARKLMQTKLRDDCAFAIATRRAEFEEKKRIFDQEVAAMSDWTLYLQFLFDRAMQFDGLAIDELRIHSAARIRPTSYVILLGTLTPYVDEPEIVDRYMFKRNVMFNGDIVYWRDGRAQLRDEGSRFCVTDNSTDDSIDMMLHLAVRRWGNRLRLKVESTALYDRIAFRAAASGVEIEFADPFTNSMVAGYRQAMLQIQTEGKIAPRQHRSLSNSNFALAPLPDEPAADLVRAPRISNND